MCALRILPCHLPDLSIIRQRIGLATGRIYLIKSALENNDTSANSLQHLDRCLTCRSCETTCPSGGYGQLIDIGRELVEEKRPVWQKGLSFYRASIFDHACFIQRCWVFI